jgi:hypothetical protein
MRAPEAERAVSIQMDRQTNWRAGRHSADLWGIDSPGAFLLVGGVLSAAEASVAGPLIVDVAAPRPPK